MERFVRPYVHDSGDSGHEVDSQTGLPGESYLADLLEYELARAKRYGWSHALLMVQIDSLQKVSGSRVRAVAERLSSVLRAGDTMLRLDEKRFAAFLPHTDAETLAPIAKRVRRELGELLAQWSASGHADRHAGTDGCLPLSAADQQTNIRVATAVFPADGQTPEMLLGRLEHSLLNRSLGPACTSVESAAS
jgi:GGDEF domain-containing protein